MSETTPRLGLPMLQAGQAQKEVLHNEALAIVDAVTCGLVEAVTNSPPESAGSGRTWIVGTAPSGPWTGHAGDLAISTHGGWRFVAPAEGMRFRLRASGYPIVRTATLWQTGRVDAGAVFVEGTQVLGRQRPAIADAAGGGVVDAEARRAISDLIVALKTHGLIGS